MSRKYTGETRERVIRESVEIVICDGCGLPIGQNPTRDVFSIEREPRDPRDALGDPSDYTEYFDVHDRKECLILFAQRHATD